MDRVRCKNEDRELQRILEENPDLLCGDQINPDDPRRWLIIKREMPVPDPATGSDRWSIDFFFADQSAMPTFVECKRFADARSRREVIGQMFDYAANGHYYWNKGDMRNLAENSASRKHLALDEAVRNLRPDDDLGTDEFFQRVEDNLREGQVRLVFFLEQSPVELRSVVEFLNKQMERCEVLIVEARQYIYEGTEIVVPMLFGYTEAARQLKRTVTVTTGSRRKWDQDSFLADARARLDEMGVGALQQLYDACKAFCDEIRWGTGTSTGSFNPVISAICPRSILTAFADGRLSINFGSLNGSVQANAFRDELSEFMTRQFDMPLPENLHVKYPTLLADEWIPKANEFIDGLKTLAQNFE